MSQKFEAEPLDSVELGSHKSHHTSGKHSDKHEEASAAHPVVAHGGHGDHGHEEIPPTKVPEWIVDMVEYVFKTKKRKTTIEMEIFTGVIQFISCLYVLPVVPYQMKRVGYDEQSSIIATSATCAIGCIIGAFLTDMPFIIAPPTSVSIFFAVSMQQAGMGYKEGNAALIISGAALAFIGIVPPIGRFLTKLIPDSIQAAISVGIGLITALAGAIEINLVVRGEYTILDMGELTPEVIVAISALVIVAVLLHYHVKGAFCIGLFLGTFTWWIISDEWPHAVVAAPKTINDKGDLANDRITLLIFNLFFLYVLTLNGLARSLSDLGNLTKPSGAIPRGNFLLIVCGLTTMLSGYFSGPPILISPETAAGIKAGAKTGLSTLVCGLLFGVSAYFSPIFGAVPAAGTAPLLIMVGVMMFGNSKRIDWTDYKLAVPAYCVLFFIPFTYSILRGVAFGYAIYIVISFYTGDYIENFRNFITSCGDPFGRGPKPKPLSQLENASDSDDEDHKHKEESEEEEEQHLKSKTFLGKSTFLKMVYKQERVGTASLDWESLGQTNTLVLTDYKDGAWGKLHSQTDPMIRVHAGATAFHYGQSAFEGLKAFQCQDGKIRIFRPELNAKRINKACHRICMPEIPESLFLEAINRAIEENVEFMPPYGTGGALYIRPLIIGSGGTIKLQPADEYTFLVIVMPVNDYYKSSWNYQPAIIVDGYDRAAPRGVGNVKVGGNYAADLLPNIDARKAGFPVALYLDAKTNSYVEEFSTSNFIATTKDRKYVTPKSDAILESITNLSLMDLALDESYDVQRRPIHVDEIFNNRFTEIGACGTAVVVTPIDHVYYGKQALSLSKPDKPDESNIYQLYRRFRRIQCGEEEDKFHWLREVR